METYSPPLFFLFALLFLSDWESIAEFKAAKRGSKSAC